MLLGPYLYRTQDHTTSACYGVKHLCRMRPAYLLHTDPHRVERFQNIQQAFHYILPIKCLTAPFKASLLCEATI